MQKIVAFLLIVIIALAPGCASQSAAPGATQPNPYQYSIIIENSTFKTETLTVKTGDIVTWTNKDNYPHTVTSVDQIFDSSEIAPGGTYSYRFDKPGNFGYFCKLHFQLNPTLKPQASIIVE